ncbi:hypothetical protein AURDEDRAFT_150681 [Auricularia subglabra TFB-10046 SS5]|nr:hypothetical protein AURDEDRAFT_150681 [Auricularia subglabra TFB-10046 SS5]
MSSAASGAPQGSMDLEVIARRISEPGTDIKLKTQLVEYLRENIDSLREQDMARYIAVVLPVVLDLLRNGQPAMRKDTPDQQLRHGLLELCHRHPHQDAFKQLVPAMAAAVLHVMRVDNEDNAVVALKIFSELARSYKQLTESHMAAFVEFFIELLNRFDQVADEIFSEDCSSTDPPATQAVPATRSFKVVSECPINIILIFQTHREQAMNMFQKLIPPVVKHIQYEAPAQKKIYVPGRQILGPNPDIKNKATFSEFINSQVKSVSFIAYALRSYKDFLTPYTETFPASTVRILQDMPPDSIPMRREMLTALRHMLSADYRSQLLLQIDILVDERVLIGRSVGSQDALRSTGFMVLADLVHHVRTDLTASQLTKVIKHFSCGVHTPSLLGQMQTVLAKLLVNLIDVVIAKFQDDAPKLLTQLLECFADRISALKSVRQDWLDMKLNKKDDEMDTGTGTEFGQIERSKPILGEAFANMESLSECLSQCKYLFRTLMHGVKNLVLYLQKLDESHAPNAELIGRIFIDCLQAMNIFEPSQQDSADEKLATDQMIEIMRELRPLVFQEVWTMHMARYLNMVKQQSSLLLIGQSLLITESTSTIFLALLLKHLSERLEDLTDMDLRESAVPIRMFKMAFLSVTHFPAKNEMMLAPHLSRLILDSLLLSARVKDPSNYYMLLRGLFRAIGGAAGRFEHLYKEVLPLLPEMLETLNKHLAATPASDVKKRDMIVELCLTVPVRLTHLVPHLRYLMQPLVLSLQGPADLVSQGLRTLELCIDNLQPEYIDPPLMPVLPALIRGLNRHLKPVPAHHVHAHTTIRILGKLGGKNRLLLHDDPELDFRVRSDPVVQTIPFGSSRRGDIDMAPVAAIALGQLTSSDKGYREHAFELAKHCLTLVLGGDIREAEYENMYRDTLRGLVAALVVEDSNPKIMDYLRGFARHVFYMEVARDPDPDTAGILSGRRMLTVYSNVLMEVVLEGLAAPTEDEVEAALELFGHLVDDVLGLDTAANGKRVRVEDRAFMLSQFAIRCQHMCHADTWLQKLGGAKGFQLLLKHPGSSDRSWLAGRELEAGTALNTVLKSVPSDAPESLVTDIKESAIVCLRSGIDAFTQLDPSTPQFRKGHDVMCAHLTPELGGGFAAVREVAYESIKYIAERTNRQPSDVIHPYRQRILGHILALPLRTLPVQKQMENMDAMTFLLNLDTPVVPENGDELLRVLHEAIGVADAEDSSLVARYPSRLGQMTANNVRICGIKLMTASLPVTDCYAKQTQTRQRVVSVYFKALYSSNQAIKDAARDGLQCLTAHTARLPREFLQTGLRPILQNLADTKALTVPGLEGLARLMQLLTNYFRVELGQRLVLHFKTLAEPANLASAANAPLLDNDSIAKLVRLLDIFHLLPQTANMYLNELVEEVVKTEFTLLSASSSPLSEPLGRYLNRYPQETVETFFGKLNDGRYVRTLRNVILAQSAPDVLVELDRRAPDLISACFMDETRPQVLYGLQIVTDLITVDPTWIGKHADVVDALIDLWRGEFSTGPKDTPLPPLWVRLALKVFMKSLELDKRVEILFDVFLLHQQSVAVDLATFSRFVHKEFITTDDLELRRNIVVTFLNWFSSPDKTRTIPHMTRLLHGVVIPLLQVSLLRKEEVVDQVLINLILEQFLGPASTNKYDNEEELLKVGILHLSSILVQYCPALLTAGRKEMIKTGWNFLNGSEDLVVKQCANIFLCRFYDAFEAPAKFILNTLSNLIRTQNTEARALTKQALDILVPTLPKRLAQDDALHWARYVRRMLNEEAQGIPQWTLIYSLVVRHRDIFYPHRAMYVPHMIGSFTKFGLSPQCNFETRSICLDLIDVVLSWERQAAAEQPAADGKASYITPLTQRESLVSFLVRLVVQSTLGPEGGQPATAQKQAEILHTRALGYLKEISAPDGWQEVTVKLNFFSRTLDSGEITTQNTNAVTNTARLLNVISAEKPDSWYQANSQTLQKLVQRGLTSDEAALHDNLLPVFKRLVQLFPPSLDDEDAQNPLPEFHAFVDQAINDGLRSAQNPRGPIYMLQAVVEVAPRKLEPFGQHLTKLLARFSRDHTLAGQANAETTLSMLRTILNICRIGVAHLSDQRKNLLTCMVMLVEKSTNVSFCRYLLEIAREWALKSREPYPTMKEKANLLLKMLTFKDRGDALFSEYLTLIYDIYTDASLRRTDLTQRLEPAFFVGCHAQDPAMRAQFLDLLDASIATPLITRLNYVFAVQSWEPLTEYNWIHVAAELLLGSVDNDEVMLPLSKQNLAGDVGFLESTQNRRVGSVVAPLRRLLYSDPFNAGRLWVSLFSSMWTTLGRKEQTELSGHITALLTREYHIKQANQRPNVIQTLLEGIHACSPSITLPPFLVKYLGKTFGAWHIAIAMLEHSIDYTFQDEDTLRQTCVDSLIELYADIAEDDMFYGAWRTRHLYPDTNQAIIFEQHGMWSLALQHYESAMIKARTGAQNYTEQEYSMWEDHYILALQKLQVWDVLRDFAKNLDDKDLWLEAMWRQGSDWSRDRDLIEGELSQLSDVATPRRKVFEAFIALQKAYGTDPTKGGDFPKLLDEAMQLTLRKWVSLPANLSAVHIPLLQHFQQFVELAEAANIFASLAVTNASNLEKKSGELKHMLITWRERLPNLEDDISIWSDLVFSRQHVFEMINTAYLPLIQSQSGTNSNASTFGYRGYHETAWTINRYAHVARKHYLLEVCHSALNKIYTLPNIEIAEAFRKLREQARCYYQTSSELQQGLEVINNTNLTFFSAQQKAEFFTLKGMFFHKLGHPDEANSAFAQAVQLDMQQPKAWAEWGQYHDSLLKEQPSESSHAASALSCYMQAAQLLTSAKSRPYLNRVLWLLSFDDGTSDAIEKAFMQHKDQMPIWYFLTLVPQLTAALPLREAKHVIHLLITIAKLFPQALFYHLRAMREEVQVRRITAEQARRAQQAQAGHLQHGGPSTSPVKAEAADNDGGVPPSPATDNTSSPQPQQPDKPPQAPWEVHLDQLYSIVKSSHPLLQITMERLADNLGKCKETPDEAAYRIISALLAEGVSSTNIRASTFGDDMAILPVNMANVTRVARSSTIVGASARAEFDNDFIKSPPQNMRQYVQKLQVWRDRYEKALEERPRVFSIEYINPYLAAFQFSKLHEIEVPGQYLEHVDNPSQFAKIAHLSSKFDLARGDKLYLRRFHFIAHDGSSHSFLIQHYIRLARREERVHQIFRTFNSVVVRRKETRRRSLTFNLPVSMPLGYQTRLLASDETYVSLQDIYDQHCARAGFSREAPSLAYAEKFKEVQETAGRALDKHRAQLVKMDILSEISAKMIPDKILTEYMTKSMKTSTDLWLMRKQFAAQLAAASFITYIASLPMRTPHRMNLSRKTGLISMTDMIPAFIQGKPLLASPAEHVPWRFTPSIQHFIGRVATEGIFVTGIVAFARSLTEPEHNLERELPLYMRDEVVHWYRENAGRMPPTSPDALTKEIRETVNVNVDGIITRTQHLACKDAWEKPVANGNQSAVQPVITLVSQSTMPHNLSQMKHEFYPWY